ncbi:hypothetical protein HID58_003832 [Brassica napus]|uniref:DNA-directed RNA polymerase III subunit RPC3 n=1 Tax=Brassica napus TaxID=3708 RepID=A0ABQ8ER83_BRANA|nr:hypothetical protein HID58_003832 [Brassica napus]
MSKESVARGIGPFRPVAGRAWAREFTSRKEAGLAGEACCGTGPKAGKPTVTRGRCGCDFHRGKKQSSTDDDGGSLSRHCFCSLLRLRTAVCSSYVFSFFTVSPMCLPFFTTSFQTPHIGHACTELCISDKKLKLAIHVNKLNNKICNNSFIERVPSPEPVLGNKDEGPAQKKRGAKASKIFKEPESLEERILEAATPVDAIRFPFIFEQGSSSTVADDDSNIPEGKRKQPEVDYSSGPSNEVIWRPNFEELIRRLRHKACVEIVKERRDEGCANVMKAMLEVGRSQEKKAKTDKSGKIADAALTEKKDTPQIVLKMWKDGYLHMQNNEGLHEYIHHLVE